MCWQSARARRDKIHLHLGLSVHPHAAPDRVDKIEMVTLTGGLQVNPAVLDADLVQALAQAGRAQQFHRGVVENAGPDAGEHMLFGASLDDDRLDTTSGQQMPQQHAS
jgi:transcriptional regulator GlxA family with amidase domain